MLNDDGILDMSGKLDEVDLADKVDMVDKVGDERKDDEFVNSNEVNEVDGVVEVD